MKNIDFDKANHKPIFERMKQHVWYLIQSVGFRLSPFFARRWRVSLYRLFGGIAGRRVSLARTCSITNPWNVIIGDNSFIGEGVILVGSTTLEIGRDVCISSRVVIHGASHDITSPTFNYTVAPVRVGDMAWIASDAIILPGITIGEGAVVAAGAVVTKDVEPWTVVGGNPAKFIKKRVLSDEANG